MILDPINDNRLYVGAAGAGLFRYGPVATRISEVHRHVERSP
jgi:hypothetical protein